MNYKQLKEALEKLNEAQLEEDVIWWGNFPPGGSKIVDMMVLEDDYVNVGEGCEPLEPYLGTEYEEDAKENIVLKKGYPILVAETLMQREQQEMEFKEIE